MQETPEINQDSEIICHYSLYLINHIYLCSNISNDRPFMLSQKSRLINIRPMSFLGKIRQDYEKVIQPQLIKCLIYARDCVKNLDFIILFMQKDNIYT